MYNRLSTAILNVLKIENVSAIGQDIMDQYEGEIIKKECLKLNYVIFILSITFSKYKHFKAPKKYKLILYMINNLFLLKLLTIIIYYILKLYLYCYYNSL